MDDTKLTLEATRIVQALTIAGDLASADFSEEFWDGLDGAKSALQLYRLVCLGLREAGEKKPAFLVFTLPDSVGPVVVSTFDFDLACEQLHPPTIYCIDASLLFIEAVVEYIAKWALPNGSKAVFRSFRTQQDKTSHFRNLIYIIPDL